MSKELFEVSSRKKYRFESPRGLLTDQDLWDLPLSGKASTANLDSIAISLFRQTKESEQAMSFVTNVSNNDTDTVNKLEIVKYIISVKLAERTKAQEASVRAEKKQQIMGLIAQKETEQLGATSLEELRKLAESL
jgi:hypothetical protein